MLERAASKVADFTALDHAGATAVWATDIEPRALAFAAANAAENGLASTVHPLRWDFTQPPPAEIAGRSFGLLLAADVTYFQAAAARVAELAIELVEPGGALLFVDGISHGSAGRKNEGSRRIFVYRYGVSWGNFRHGYHPSDELLARLTPERRQIVWPQRPRPEGPQKKTN